MTAWNPHEYSNTEVDKAVRMLSNKNISQVEYIKYVKIFDDWRSSYVYPLLSMHIYTRKKAIEIEDKCIVSQRLKRKESIFAKIARIPDMRASRMQDIGGCRVVFKSIDSVYKLRNALRNSRRKHILQNEKDYIQSPKESGYRGIHMVYKYVGKENTSNNILIETQIRTHLQHLWATSVETTSFFTQNPLKSSIGPNEWLRFFCLVSSLFAIEEKQPIVPGTPLKREDIISEIKSLENQYHLFDQLRAYNVAARHITNNNKAYYYVLVLKFNEQLLSITPFPRNQIKEATEMYNNYENADADNNVVLVSADSISALKKAYPNYFMNTKEFVDVLERILAI